MYVICLYVYLCLKTCDSNSDMSEKHEMHVGSHETTSVGFVLFEILWKAFDDRITMNNFHIKI